MKAVAFSMLFLLAGLAACGQTLIRATEATLEWDAVTVDADGDPLEGVTYEVAVAVAGGDLVVIAATDQTTVAVTVPAGGKCVYAVRAVWNGARSEYTRSDVGGAPEPWIVKRPAAPGGPQGLRIRK